MRATAVVVVFGLGLCACADTPKVSERAVTETTGSAKTAVTVGTTPVTGPFPIDGGGYGPTDYSGPALTLFAQRVTAGGARLFLRGVRYPPTSNPPAGWVAPGWCSPSGEYRLSLIDGDLVGILAGPVYSALKDGLAVTVENTGYAEGSPRRVMVAQVDGDVSSVTVTWTDHATDTAPVSDGWVLLTAHGEASNTYSLRLDGASGSRTVSSTDLPNPTSYEWQKACTEPVAVLPAPGKEQPADAAAAEQQIRDRFTLLWNRDVPFSTKGADLLNDTTGVAAALARANKGPFAAAVKSSTHTLTELVFVSSTEAWFTYDVQSPMANFIGKFGVARLVNGKWVFDRAMSCQDIALAQDACVPAVAPLIPPGQPG